MSSVELEAMQSTNRVVQGGGGQTYISVNGAGDFRATAPSGSLYVEFDVPVDSLVQGGKQGWFKMLGPDASKSQKFMLGKQGGEELPKVGNVKIVDMKGN